MNANQTKSVAVAKLIRALVALREAKAVERTIFREFGRSAAKSAVARVHRLSSRVGDLRSEARDADRLATIEARYARRGIKVDPVSMRAACDYARGDILALRAERVRHGLPVRVYAYDRSGFHCYGYGLPLAAEGGTPHACADDLTFFIARCNDKRRRAA